MNAENPAAIARALSALFEAELQQVHEEREATRVLDVAALRRRASERQEFNDEVERLLSRLRRTLPEPGARDDDTQAALIEMKAWAALLRQSEAVTQALIDRARPVLAGYLEASDPLASTYDARGRRRGFTGTKLTRASARISQKV